MSRLALFLVVGDSVAEEGAGENLRTTVRNLNDKRRNGDSLNSKVEQRLHLLLNQGFADKAAFGVELRSLGSGGTSGIPGQARHYENALSSAG